MRLLYCFFFFFCLVLPSISAESIPVSQERSLPEKRSFDDIFPGLPSAIRNASFSSNGYYNSVNAVSRQNIRSFGSSIDTAIIEAVFLKQPKFLIESILVIPDTSNRYSLLDIYNALGKVRGLKGKRYHSYTRNEYVPLFEDVTRIVSPQRNTAIPDPAPATAIPPSETIYMRLKDVNFGNTYYRGNVTLAQHGLRYSLSNNKNITYLFIPVIKEEKFSVQLYFEPIVEGVLIYALAGADISDFMSSRVNMASAISKRLAVIISWVVEGITGNTDA